MKLDDDLGVHPWLWKPPISWDGARSFRSEWDDDVEEPRSEVKSGWLQGFDFNLQWIGWREYLQETIVFMIKHRGFLWFPVNPRLNKSNEQINWTFSAIWPSRWQGHKTQEYIKRCSAMGDWPPKGQFFDLETDDKPIRNLQYRIWFGGSLVSDKTKSVSYRLRELPSFDQRLLAWSDNEVPPFSVLTWPWLSTILRQIPIFQFPIVTRMERMGARWSSAHLFVVLF